jgi:arylsulfatase A-like enzyme
VVPSRSMRPYSSSSADNRKEHDGDWFRSRISNSVSILGASSEEDTLRFVRIAAIAIIAMGWVVHPLLPADRARSEVSRQTQAVQSAGPSPNVLIVVTDDQPLGAMGVMPQTRQIFATEGVRFEKAYATTPLCCPSRASIFTGQFTHNHNVLDTESAQALDHETTLEAYLRQAGYATAIVGKYLNLWDIGDDPPFFDRWAIFNDDYGVDGYRNEKWNVDGRVSTISRYTTTVIGDKALEFLTDLEADDQRPWLLYVFPFAPHSPYKAHSDYAHADVPPWRPGPATRETNLSDKPLWVRRSQVELSEARRVRRAQLRTLMSVDDLMGRLSDHLQSLGEDSNTMIFYLSDNGLTWGDHGLVSKRNPYTHSVRVPYFMRSPGLVPGTVDQEQPVANIDIAPTVLDAAGVIADPFVPMDGRSLLGERSRDRMHLEYFEEAGMPSWASTVEDNLQYIEYYAADGENITFRELYRLDSDPLQLRNVLKDGNPSNNPSPETLRSLSRRLADDRRCAGSSCP